MRLARVNSLFRLFCVFVLCLLLSAGLVWGQNSAGQKAGDAPAAPPPTFDNPAPQTAAPSSTASTGQRLAPGDLVDVSVYNVPDLNTKARVADSGDVYLPLIAYVHIGGLTIEEAQGVLEKRLSDGGFVRDPHVSLFVNESASQGTNVLGSVAKPGVYTVAGDHRLLDLISAAGGFSQDAGRTVSVTHRSSSGPPVTVVLARNVTDSGDSNIAVSPGDTLYVHKADVIYVVGDVLKPSGIYVDRDDLTVLQALALAGGPTRDAKLNGARIVRKGPTETTETPVELKKILQAKAPDLPLQPNDILFVPSKSGFFSAARSGATIALQATTTVAYLTIVR